jgi:hypothetical protein
MPDVFRAYVPTVKVSNFPHIVQANVAALQAARSDSVYPDMCGVDLDPRLPHRKIYALMYSASATYNFDYDLVATLSGREVYRQKLAQWANAGNNRWISGAFTLGTNQGGINESIIVLVNATNVLINPWRINLTCDRMYLHINVVNPAASLFDMGLRVISQAGI